jgi:hypothetical protein
MLRSGSNPEDTPSVPPEVPPASFRAEARGRLPGRLRHLAAKLGLLLASVTAVLLAAEAGTRLLSRVGPSLLVTDPVIGKHYVPGFDGRVFVDEAGREIHLRFNREGFRGPDHPRGKPTDTRRVAVVGDSMISALAVEEEKTLVRRLERSLRGSESEPSIEVLNFGVSSSSTGQELALYRNLVSAYQPDVVLLAFFVGNDFADNSHRLTRAPRIYFDLDETGRPVQVWAPERPGALSRWLNLHSRFYVWQKRAVRILRGARPWPSRSLPPVWRVFEPPESLELREAWRLLAALLRQFDEDVEANGSRLAVVVVPSAHQIHDDLWAALVAEAGEEGPSLDRELPRRRLEEIAREVEFPLLDLTPVFREANAGRPSTSPSSPFLLGRYHLSEEGHRLAADALMGLLVGSGLGILKTSDIQVLNCESRPLSRTRFTIQDLTPSTAGSGRRRGRG